eukprot:TRINITY_DN45122_c0_g1_i1.p2 TRINITY_DN45122_c0_g1~~TRINITY_DN45122_c0_g1_i1.p2  ORF type:complete len:176 (-),score=17.72 TRINITY_DN45122_c0_g1_i1:161-688(-)
MRTLTIGMRDTGAEDVIMKCLQERQLGGNILELGCGSSVLARFLCQLPGTLVTAVDVAEESIRSMQQILKHNLDVELGILVGTQLPFRDGSFDVIVDKGTMDAIDCGGLTFKYIDEVRRVLTSNGWLLLVTCRDYQIRQEQLCQAFKIQEIAKIRESEDRSCPCAMATVILCKRR